MSLECRVYGFEYCYLLSGLLEGLVEGSLEGSMRPILDGLGFRV